VSRGVYILVVLLLNNTKNTMSDNKIFLWSPENIEKYYKMFEGIGINGRIDLLLKFKADKHYKKQPTYNQQIMLDFWFGKYCNVNIAYKESALGKNILEKTLETMAYEKLITYVKSPFTNNYELAIEPRGILINSKGGWKRHIIKNKLTIVTPQIFGLIGVVTGAIGLCIAFGQYAIKKEESIRAEKSDSTIQVLQSNIKHLQYKIQQDSIVVQVVKTDLTKLLNH